MWGRGPTGFFPYKWSLISEAVAESPIYPLCSVRVESEGSSPLLQCFFHISCSQMTFSVFFSSLAFWRIKIFSHYIFLCFHLNLHTFYFLNGDFINVIVRCSVAKSCLTLCKWTATHQASLSLTISQNLPKFMSIESVVISNHLILCHPLRLLPSIFPSIRIFQWVSYSHQVAKVSGASVLPVCIRGWLPLGLTGLISLLSRGHRWYSVSFCQMFTWFQ